MQRIGVWVLVTATGVGCRCTKEDGRDRESEAPAVAQQPPAVAQQPPAVAQQPPAVAQQPAPAASPLTLPPGFRATVFADLQGTVRHVAVRDNGDVFVNKRDADGGGSLVAMRDRDGDGRADEVEYFENRPGTGIAVFAEHLYFSSDAAVFRKRLHPTRLVPEAATETIVSGFPDQASHAAKSLAIDTRGNLFVDVGAPSNACQRQPRTPGSPGLRPCPQLRDHGGIWRYDADRTGQAAAEGERWATGLRHVVALAVRPGEDQLYGVQHGRDQLHQLFPRHYTPEQSAELPAEQLFRLSRGFAGGWPYTYYDQIRGERMVAPEYGGDGKTPAKEGRYPDPVFAFPGHYAPNALLFYNGDSFPDRYHGGAFVAFHGSWNRAPLPQRGYHVAFVPFSGTEPSGPAEVFANGFAGRDVVRRPSQARYRPMGLAQGPDGALFISDSAEGMVWRITFERG